MPPPRQTPPPLPRFDRDEKVLCFHMELLYEAKILDIQLLQDGSGFQYKIHYKGWKSTWDDWVPADRIRKFDEENKQLAADLHAQARNLNHKTVVKQPKKPVRISNGGSESGRAASEERVSSGRGRGPRRSRDNDLESEEQFYERPTIKLIELDDVIKGLLVDDWENITRQSQLLCIPHAKPVNVILADYMADERRNRKENSGDMDILEETVAGIREYFNRAFGNILLYRFERPQWHDVEQMIREEKFGMKTPADAYGAEHLGRLLSVLGELVAQTNMDQQSIIRLREELAKFGEWLRVNAAMYFGLGYETAPQGYAARARVL